MKRSKAIQTSIVASVAATLLSCEGTPPPTRYCVDQQQRVLDDRECQQTTSGGHVWYYGRSGYVPTGTRISGGSFQTPSEGFTSNSVSAEGGTVRGGIGASGEAAAGHASGGAGE
jgi:hypothetical protein